MMLTEGECSIQRTFCPSAATSTIKPTQNVLMFIPRLNFERPMTDCPIYGTAMMPCSLVYHCKNVNSPQMLC